MRRYSLLVALLSGCLHHATATSVEGAVLGRVVIYRNGVAFYERSARIENGQLAVHVPRDRVDDFLKSLTVVDPHTRKPLSVSIPRKEAEDGQYLTMMLQTPGQERADVLLTYVTEAPAWKPSYRVVVGDQGKVMLEGWAIVDNVSGEDWKDVLVGVGASSAMSFRYDLWSVRRIDRDLLQGEDKFAVAPPTGVSPYTEAGGEEIGQLDGSEVRTGPAGAPAGRTFQSQVGVAAGSQSDNVGVSFSGSSSIQNTYTVDGVNNSATTGVRGKVTSTKGEPLAGVTVIATSPNSPTQTAITDEQGNYLVAASPGTYTLDYYYADVTVERKNVQIADNRIAQLSTQKINEQAAGGEVIQIKAEAPMIDPTSTTQGITIDKNYIRNIPVPGKSFEQSMGAAAGTPGYYPPSSAAPPPPPPVRAGDEKLAAAAKKINASHKDVLIAAGGLSIEDAKQKAEAARNKLIDEGVPAKSIHIKTAVDSSGIRLLAIAPGSEPAAAPPTAHTSTPSTPVGESNFMAEKPMDVKAGSSAMVAMVHSETDGGVVYLYDPISDRGDKKYAFKAVKLANPTGDTLEPGPVTVYGTGRFIGEGITEPVPPHANVVVPFAADRQIVVETAGTEKDKIARLMTAQRGIVTAEVQHRRATTYTLTSRLDKPAKVFVRHKTDEGWTIVDAPKNALKVGDSQLYEVDVPAYGTQYVTIAETTPMERSLQLASEEALGMMKVYLEEPDATPELKKQLSDVLSTHKDAADLIDKIQTMHDQLAEYKERSGELHAQIVTLKLVKTGGDLLAALHHKLDEISDKQQKLTIKIVDAQESLMLTRVKFQNQLAELHLTDATASR
ncbi:MAG: carboxypeptidase regulatory-like domain-containing protein [Kofleriaceae bacterium]